MGIKFVPPSAEELARRGVGDAPQPAKAPIKILAPAKPRKKTAAKPKE